MMSGRAFLQLRSAIAQTYRKEILCPPCRAATILRNTTPFLKRATLPRDRLTSPKTCRAFHGSASAMAKDTMKAVVFNGPMDVGLVDRPIPKIQDPTDLIVKVRYSALCGSELHVFRGHQPSDTGFIMGHESTGEVIEVGSAVKTHKKGDILVMPFTLSCGECFYCQHGYSSRCKGGLLFGTTGLDGGQAEYLRVPLADSTAVKAPEGIDEKKLVLMADIFPTGYFAAKNAFKDLDKDEIKDSVVVLFGCGPVGLCALVNALDYNPRKLIAVDRVPERLQLAEKLGAEAWNDKEDWEGLKKRILDLTDGRGADAVIEGVGHEDALKSGFELLRPWGVISSFGVHNEGIPWTGNQAYGKNLRIQMGRCPVRSVFEEALEALRRKQDQLDFMCDKIMPLSQALDGYEIFNNMKAHKVIFEPHH